MRSGEIERQKPRLQLDLVTNPEFLSEGKAVQNLLKPYRIILGGANPSALEKIKKIYNPWLNNNIPILEMDANLAEMTKHSANCTLATTVSFINEISRLCDKTNANIQSVQVGIGFNPRIGSLFLNVGPGFGRSCLPKDLATLSRLNDANDENMNLFSAAVYSNTEQTKKMILKISSVIKKHKVHHITIW